MAEKTSKFKVDTESRNKLNIQAIHRKGHHRDKRPSMVSEMGSRIRGSYGNLQHNYNSRTSTFGSNRAISLDHYNHRRMSDGIQTVTSDSTVYYKQRLNEQDVLLRTASGKKALSCQDSTDVKFSVSDDPMANSNLKMFERCSIDENEESNRVKQNRSSSFTSKNNSKSKLSSNVNVSSSPKSIITRLRQLTGRLSFSFDKDSRRISGGTHTIIKTSPLLVNSSSRAVNVLPHTCCKPKIALENRSIRSSSVTSRNRALSLDVSATKYCNSSGASSNDGSRKSLEPDGSTDNNSVSASKRFSSEVEASDI